jgi:hypothetical protein
LVIEDLFVRAIALGVKFTLVQFLRCPFRSDRLSPLITIVKEHGQAKGN